MMGHAISQLLRSTNLVKVATKPNPHMLNAVISTKLLSNTMRSFVDEKVKEYEITTSRVHWHP